jgi:hypothetical protein
MMDETIGIEAKTPIGLWNKRIGVDTLASSGRRSKEASRSSRATRRAPSVPRSTRLPPSSFNRCRPPSKDQPQQLWGALADLMESVKGVDLTEPTGEIWAAEQGGRTGPQVGSQ